MASLCISCRHTVLRQSHRTYASTATAAAESSPSSSSITQDTSPNSALNHGIKPVYNLRTSIVLSRPPFLTRTPHPFENAYYLYQKRLNERTSLPFSRYFYIKKGTPAEVDWKRKIKARQTAARDIGVYNAYSKEAWNDELLVGDTMGDQKDVMDALLADAEDVGDANAGTAVKKTVEPLERPMPRVSAADEQNNVRSLDRSGERTLHLLVKDGAGLWKFPEGSISGREGLNKSAERILFETAGPNVNTWIVGHAPVGHLANQYETPQFDTEKQTLTLGDKVFFMKARIMAGQVDLSNCTLGFEDYKWLTSEEIKEHVEERYWRYTEKMLAER